MPPTLSVESRIDIRILATLARYYTDKGNIQLSKSSIIRQACNDLVNELVKRDAVVPSESVEQSLSYLEKRGLGPGSRRPSLDVFREIAMEDETPSGVVNEKMMQKALEKLDEQENISK